MPRISGMISSVADISTRSRCLVEYIRRQENYLFRFVPIVLNSRTQQGVSSENKKEKQKET